MLLLIMNLKSIFYIRYFRISSSDRSTSYIHLIKNIMSIWNFRIVCKTRDFSIFSLKLFCFCSPSLFYLLVHSRCRGFLFSLDHTQAHTTVDRTPLDEGSARRRDFYVTTQTLYKTNIHAHGGIQTYDSSKLSVAGLRLRLRSHWDRPLA
jgi:hypothetical protein